MCADHGNPAVASIRDHSTLPPYCSAHPKHHLAMIWFSALFLWNIIFHGTPLSAVLGFSQPRSTFVTGGRRIITHVGSSSRTRSNHRNNHAPPNRLTMRDASASYWFQVGDTVEVVQDVLKAHGTVNLKGRVGIVVATWEKCNVDPACSCAEQVDTGMAVRVEFPASTEDDPSFQHYFAEDELVKVAASQLQPEDDEEETNIASSQQQKSDLPFDGMSCVAFKLEHLDSEKKPRRIASYDPNSKPTNAPQ